MKKNGQSAKEIRDYILGNTLGQGTFSKVKLGTHKVVDESVAIKILQKSKINDVADTERVLRQIHILKVMRHPNIVQLYDIVETPKKLLLVMEFMENGELFNYIIKKQRIDEEEACKMFHQLIDAIEHIHKIGIVHRDLKPQNLLLDHRNNLKLVDFGLSNTYNKNQKLKTPCGSQSYAAPEMLRGESYEGLKVDIWSAGVILFAMLCGYLPFEQNDNFHSFYDKIANSDYKIHKDVSGSGRDLISKILRVDTQTRYTIEQIRNHPWMKINQPSISTRNHGILLEYNRIPIDEEVLHSLTQYGLSQSDIEKTRDNLQANRHNSLTTIYYLALKKLAKQGNHSKYDLNSSQFNADALINPNQTVVGQCSSGIPANVLNGMSKKSIKSIKQSAKISVMVDNFMSKENNTEENRQKPKNKEKSKERARRKSKDKITHEKSVIETHKDRQNTSVSKNKLVSKENINPNAKQQLSFKPRRQRVNSRPNKVDPAIENSINYGRGPLATNSINLHQSIDKSIRNDSCKQKHRESHIENRLSRKYKQKFNQSLVSQSYDKQHLGLKNKANSSQMMSQNISNMHIHSTRQQINNVNSNREEKQKASNKEDIKQIVQKQLKGRNRRVLSHKNKKSIGCINQMKSDLTKIPKAKWI